MHGSMVAFVWANAAEVGTEARVHLKNLSVVPRPRWRIDSKQNEQNLHVREIELGRGVDKGCKLEWL